jgi:CRISPR-associated protein Cmr6
MIMSWNNFIAPNIGLLIYKRLYSETGIFNYIRVIHENHEEKLEINFPDNVKPFDPYYKAIYYTTLAGFNQIENPQAKQKFMLYTIYPGLTVGSGYTHDSNVKGDIKIGFYFDHTSGQPIIPGSSVKGVLKSIFENEDDVTDTSSISNLRFIIEEILKDCKVTEKAEWLYLLEAITNENVGMIKKLKEDIFGNQDNEGKDVFFDAVIDFIETGVNKRIFGNDFVTPHPNPLKDPTPLMFLKILPSVAFEFRFLLVDSEIANIENPSQILKFTAKKKELLFQKILLTIGIGAKTNVGYGQFKAKNGINSDYNSKKSTKLNPGVSLKDLKVGDVIDARITDLSSGIVVELDIKDVFFKPKLIGVSTKGFVKDQVIKVKIEQIGKHMKFNLESPK